MKEKKLLSYINEINKIFNDFKSHQDVFLLQTKLKEKRLELIVLFGYYNIMLYKDTKQYYDKKGEDIYGYVNLNQVKKQLNCIIDNWTKLPSLCWLIDLLDVDLYKLKKIKYLVIGADKEEDEVWIKGTFDSYIEADKHLQWLYMINEEIPLRFYNDSLVYEEYFYQIVKKEF